MDQTLENLKYPTGRFAWKEVTKDEVSAAIQTIKSFPEKLTTTVQTLSDAELDTPYREGGWTARQVVHHIADSHMNGYIRFKLALTEESPVIKPYKESLWAELVDSKLPVQISLDLIRNIHLRWVALMEHMKDEEWKKGFTHPEHNRFMILNQVATLYAWHGGHHHAHVKLAIGNRQ